MKKIIGSLLIIMSFFSEATAQSEQFHLTNPQLLECKLVRISAPLTTLSNKNAPMGPNYRSVEEENDAQGQIRLHKAVNANALPKGLDPAMQTQYNLSGTVNSPATLNLQFPGLGYTGVNPSDNNMASGPNHIVQMINNNSSSLIRIWDKVGTILVNSIVLSTISGISGLGDPVVLYDQIADRWLISEIANAGNHVIICVSQTANPAGAYFVYNFTTPQFPDYIKLATWGNSYLVTSNENSPAIYAMDRAKMLLGTPTTAIQRFTIPAYPTIGFQAATPVDFVGSINAPANSPALLMRMADDAWTTGIVDRLEIFSFNVDWVTPANTTFTGPALLPTLPFSTNFCGYTTFSCIPQQGSSVKLDPLREVLMNKIFYRNFGTYESIVCTHVNELDGNSHAGVRWYELRKTPPSTNWVIYQQGTYGQASDPLHRWMSCIAINGDGSIGLGYNVAGPTSFPSIRFTGRKVCDPLNVMTEPEQTVIAGTAPNASIRYGDYNGMTIDPVDGSFWITGNYNPSSQWATRVANFSISPVCGGCSPTITGQPANANVCAGTVVNYTVTANGSPLTYQWQISINGGTNFNDIISATLPSYSFTATAIQNGYQYRCVVTGTCAPTTAISNAATLTIIAAPSIAQQPVDANVCVGGNTGFSVIGLGGSLTYQWQVSTNGGGTFTNLTNTGVYSGTTVAAMNITGATLAMNTYQYRCVISGACSPAATSTAGILTVNIPVSISLQPVNSILCVGTNGGFTLTAAGSSPSYQWQVSTNGGTTFNNLGNTGVYSGTTTNTLNITGATTGMNTYLYRCIVTGPAACSVVISGTASLSVFPLPVVSLIAFPYQKLFPGLSTTLTATAVPTTVTYSWYKNNTLITTNTGTTLAVNIDGLGDYKVIVRDGNGCISLPAQISISDSITNRLFIYPNPTSGIFQVRYHNGNIGSLPWNLVILDAKGARGAINNYTITGPYDKMEVDLRPAGHGIYWVELRDKDGKRLAVGRVAVL